MVLDSLCIICEEPTDPENDYSIVDTNGIVCENCARKLDLTTFDVLPCLECGWPIFDNMEAEDQSGFFCKRCSPPKEKTEPGKFYGPLCGIEGEENV